MVDIIIVGLIAFSILISLWRGFVSEALSLAGWVLAFWVASNFYPYLSGYLTQVNSIYLQKFRIFTQWRSGGSAFRDRTDCMRCHQCVIK